MALIKDSADAASRERQAAMPNPVSTARRGIIIGRYMGLDQKEAAMMVMTACSAAIASVEVAKPFSATWLRDIHREAERIYLKCGRHVAP